MSKMLQWLEEHIKNTSTEELKKEWKEVEKLNLGVNSPKVFQELDIDFAREWVNNLPDKEFYFILHAANDRLFKSASLENYIKDK